MEYSHSGLGFAISGEIIVGPILKLFFVISTVLKVLQSHPIPLWMGIFIFFTITAII